MTVSLTHRGSIAVLDLGDDENRFSPQWLQDVSAALDRVVEGESTALLTTASGKFFTNGLDLDWLMANSGEWESYVARIHGLLARVLTLPVPTVAAVNGHAFGGGAMLAMAHDFRVMRADRGYLCFPEVDIRIPFTPGMAALIQAKTTPRTAVEAMTTGRRYGGADAEAAGLVDLAVPEDRVVAAAAEIVAPLVGKDAATLGAIKGTMYAAAAAALLAS